MEKLLRMKRSIVPQGFEITSHSIFREYFAPLHELRINDHVTPTYLDEKLMDSNLNRDFSSRCAICLCPFSNPVTLLSCQHYFCMDCLLMWYKRRISCPLCKASGTYFLQNGDSLSHYPLKLWRVEGSSEPILQTLLIKAARNHILHFEGFHKPKILENKQDVIVSPTQDLSLENELHFLEENINREFKRLIEIDSELNMECT